MVQDLEKLGFSNVLLPSVFDSYTDAILKMGLKRAPVHPKAKIIDVLKDGAHVRLSVQNEIKPTKALLPTGAIFERPSWTEVAFTNSNDGVRRSSIREDVSPMRMKSHGSPDRKAYDKKMKLDQEMELLRLNQENDDEFL